ncbi:protein Wnt-16-like [Sipha flava]|uniref:Protein Wnt n=2 Tax=Sipha flava TaxID=143950 RepID=A0A8B8GJA5_9HEMI|nr:protein Wnt-16-like [Sipha flava]XP_025423006.1 protein Wnt-16-like [Sipha flava]XP_025423015.1 protein Wnt-16-like [Sipha flava]
MRRSTGIFRLIVLLLPFVLSASPNWMYLGIIGIPPPLQQQQASPGAEIEDPEIVQARAICSALPGLASKQVDVCLKHPNAIYSVSDGAKKAIEQCQFQFRHERWNCSVMENEQSVFGPTLDRGSKETAFIYAITSAGVVYSITHACSSGKLTECSCDSMQHGQTTPEGWKWGGCSDNLRFGLQFSRKFVDGSEPNRRPDNFKTTKQKRIWADRLKMNLHNNEIGRQIVISLMKMHCRCHGVSGSCELKTCWKFMPSFNEIGNEIKQKYGKAVLINHIANDSPKKNHTTIHKKRETRALKRLKRRLLIESKELVHIQKSPNYCKQDFENGVLGTEGRKCNITSTGPDSCNKLCCGRGFITRVVKEEEHCNCKFIWCCYVKCDTCYKNIEQNSCK